MVDERAVIVVGLVGSLRKISFNRSLYNAAVELAPPGLRLIEAPIGDLPLYNDDIDVDGGPEPVRAFRRQIYEADGLLFVTPEFNYSIPGALVPGTLLSSGIAASHSMRSRCFRPMRTPFASV